MTVALTWKSRLESSLGDRGHPSIVAVAAACSVVIARLLATFSLSHQNMCMLTAYMSQCCSSALRRSLPCHMARSTIEELCVHCDLKSPVLTMNV